MTTLPIFFIGSRLSTGSCRGEHCSPAGFTRLVDLPGWLQRAAYMPPPDCRKTFFDFMHHLRPIEWFVGNGLDRSVPLCQRHDVTRKPRAIRRDFMRCARPDVRMGQDPSLQISRKRTFFTNLQPPPKSAGAEHGILVRSTAGHAAWPPCRQWPPHLRRKVPPDCRSRTVHRCRADRFSPRP